MWKGDMRGDRAGGEGKSNCTVRENNHKKDTMVSKHKKRIRVVQTYGSLRKVVMYQYLHLE